MSDLSGNGEPKAVSPDEARALRRDLATVLARVDPEQMAAAFWAANALQTGRAEAMSGMLSRVPEDAASDGILGGHAIYPWELETLANELLATPQQRFTTALNIGDWPILAEIANMLRRVEGAEYGVRRTEQDIFMELGRISARQFEWQRGFVTTAEFYRSVAVYGQGECERYMREAHGVGVAEMTFVGYSVMAGMLGLPVLRPRTDLQVLQGLGMSAEAVKRVLARISAPVATVRAEASRIRGQGQQIAYSPSILRRFPCLLFGPGGRRMRAPLPDLITGRVTSGLFYDVIGGGGAVRDEYGRRFEGYVHRLFEAMLPGLPLEREWTYRRAGSNFNTPDLISIDDTGTVAAVMECKASRMSIAARFDEDPSGDRGYGEMAKGVSQIWRFFSHCRLGLTGRQAAEEARCMVVCLDDWFLARGAMVAEVLRRAHALADGIDGGLPQEDRRPVAFVSINEIEVALRTATPNTFLAAVDRASGEDRRGWLFQSLHDDITGRGAERRPYPFDDDLEELLPWWRLLREAKDAQGEARATSARAPGDQP